MTYALLLIGGSVVGAAAIYGFVWLMRFIRPGFGDEPPPDKSDPLRSLKGRNEGL